ncbi:hypothetical protein [Asticcacaulis sp. EMRT-3]|uniref:hypothetical protein n=1 Tax=Asticcacaulis sp. EMRT-3 TaxID=3040349 RepID=UPI0024AFD8CA|nr:hypothetical protein [Asticcacaulis sp. EMRT-3]MDI7774995.1 hypothetical protein [Asticcacaulis sp. EMRT-3]
MKSDLKLICASLLVLSVVACSPSNPSSQASASADVSVAQSAADNVNPDNAPVPEPEAPASDTTVSNTVESSAAASSVTVVIARSTDTYDPAVITEMGRRPGYWEVRHNDPFTHKQVIDKVCIDKATGDRMVRDGGHVTAPADRRGIKSAANWLGNCPTDTRAGDVVRHDGKRVNAWNDNRPENRNNPGRDNQNHTAPTPPVPGHDQTGHDQAGHDQNINGHDRASASDHGHDQTPTPSHNPHNTPAEGHDSHSSVSSWSHDRKPRDHQG